MSEAKRPAGWTREAYLEWEARQPVRYELVDGSGGCGTHRGGMGLRRIYRAERECRLRLDGSRLLSSPWGLDGGLPRGRPLRLAATTLVRTSIVIRVARHDEPPH